MTTLLQSKSTIDSDVLHALIEAASLAPSPDNNQPWAFRCVADAIEVCHVRERAVPSDVNDLFSWIGLGAAIENLVLKASEFEFDTTVSYCERPFPQHGKHEKIAAVRLHGNAQADPLAEFLAERVTNRKHYDRSPLADSDLQPLNAVIENTDDQIDWLTEQNDLKQLASLVASADRIRFEHQQFHEEFHRVLRFGDEQALSTRDGLEFKTLEAPAIARPLFRWLKPWNRMKWANRFGMSRVFAKNSATQVIRSGAIGLLTTSVPSDEGYLQAGRSFQRIWLAATRAGLSFQPLGALPLFLMKLQIIGRDAFADAHAKKLASALKSFSSLFPHASMAGLVMLFRIGHAEPPSARSVRYTIKDVLAL